MTTNPPGSPVVPVTTEIFALESVEWDFKWPSVPNLIKKPGEVYDIPMCDRDSLDR
jgi:hypothetical protein